MMTDRKDDDKKCSSCGRSDCPTRPVEGNPVTGMSADDELIRRQLGRIRTKLLVMSGKGGVGKSTCAVNLAVALARRGHRTGLLDIDIHGPSLPMMLGLETGQIRVHDGVIQPVEVYGIRAMSVGLALPHPDKAVIWRGPMKASVIRQFVRDVDWGDLDVLVIDSPPGTGDEPLTMAKLLDCSGHAVIVSTPQPVAVTDVRKSIVFCRQVGLDVRGVIENMSGFVCPHCGVESPIFETGGAAGMAEEMGVRFLGRLPIIPSIGRGGDRGTPFALGDAGDPAVKAFEGIVASVLME